MRSRTIIKSLLLSCVILVFFSCSKDYDQFDDFTNQEVVNEKAVLFTLGEQSFTDRLNLELNIPANNFGFEDTSQLLLSVYIQYKDDGDTTWRYIPLIDIDQDYRISYSRGDEESDLSLIVEKSNTSESYGKPIYFKALRVIGYKASSITHLTRKDLDPRDYDQMINFFNLR